MTKRGAGAHPALLFCLEVRITGGGIWAADKTVQCHQHLIFIPEGCLTIAQRFNVGCGVWSLNLPQSRRDGHGLATYQEANYKPFIIAAMIFMARIKDPVAALKKLSQ